jgi:hypothetical protein
MLGLSGADEPKLAAGHWSDYFCTSTGLRLFSFGSQPLLLTDCSSLVSEREFGCPAKPRSIIVTAIESTHWLFMGQDRLRYPAFFITRTSMLSQTHILQQDKQMPDQSKTVECGLCGERCTFRGEYEILQKHRASLWQCDSCEYAFLENPTWLDEAYSSAITKVDIGPLYRCMENSRALNVILRFWQTKECQGLDYGAGYGLLVRRMRDLGYQFFWYDTHCENIFARGFESQLSTKKKFEIVTAFEVLEHLFKPKVELDQIISSCDSFVFSTQLLPDPLPPFDQWWYFAPEHGQHISFYTEKSLRLLAKRHGKRFVTNGSDLHMITTRPVSNFLFRWLTKSRVTALLGLIFKRPSLLMSDFYNLRARALGKPVN